MSRVVGWKEGTMETGLIALVMVLAIIPSFHLSAQDIERGKAVYEKWCTGCHGDTGAGDGDAAAYMLPRPRDFRRAVYQIRTTASGELPTDDDIRHVVDQGMPGTAMTGWKSRLTSGDRDAVIAYIKSFSRFFDGAPPQSVDFPSAPRISDDGITEGARIYGELECFKCHGDRGRGDGTSAPTMSDDWDFPIRPTDLTRPWTFNGGAEVEDIYRAIRTGLDGTPMPSFSDVIDAEIITDEQLWRVAQYVHSLAPGRPRVREVIRAGRTARVPDDPTDSAWVEAEAFYVPLVGQIIVSPRWFTPTVDGIWVRALHDGERLALHIAWSDPSASPDPLWQEWIELLATTVTDADGALEPVQGPDRFTIQFPARLSDGMARPSFLGGDRRRPAYTWRWRSSPDQLEVGTSTGLGQFVAGAGAASDVAHQAVFADGQWQLQVTRTLIPRDTSAAPTFAEGVAIPIAFRAADGSSGETHVRGSVSAWYAIYLDAPISATVFVMPVVATLVTAGFGLLVVWRAQRREATT